MQIKYCEYCKKLFETNNNKKRCCSASCSSKLPWLNPEYRQRMCDIQKEVQNREERKSIASAWSKLWWKNQENRIHMCDIQKEVQNTPQMKERKSIFQKQYKNRKQVKQHLSKKQKEWLSKQQNLSSMKQKVRMAMNSKEVKLKISNAMKQRFKNPINKQYLYKPKSLQLREQHSKYMLQKWKTEEYINNKNSGFFKRKQYILPSGAIVKVQGNQNIFLDEYFKTGGLQIDILIEDKEIFKQIGLILYQYDKKIHRYIPDFYIKSSNTIVEIKSAWTYKNHKELTHIKLQHCKNIGFNIQLIVYS